MIFIHLAATPSPPPRCAHTRTRFPRVCVCVWDHIEQQRGLR